MTHETTLISAETLAGQIDKLILIDCRSDLFDPELGQKQYEAGHIPKAAFFALHQVLSGPKSPTGGRHPLPDPEQLVQAMRDLGANNDSLVVAYDAGPGVYAARLWWLLRWCGHPAVCVLDGGYAAWTQAGFPTEAGLAQAPGSRPQGNFSRRPALEVTVSSEALLEGLGKGGHRIVDARAAERYRGDVEPLDPVAGHIPGAINRPNTLNLRPDGRFKPVEVLRAEWLANLQNPVLQTPSFQNPLAKAEDASEVSKTHPASDPDRALAQTAERIVVHSCGSGVSACHNLLSMRLAGLHEGLALHPGSWSEWCADPTRPVARGEDS